MKDQFTHVKNKLNEKRNQLDDEDKEGIAPEVLNMLAFTSDDLWKKLLEMIKRT